MRRPSREKKREQKHSASSAAPAAVPIDVHVPAAGPAAGTASIGGVPVVASGIEEIQDAVLHHLHRIALATGHPVHATVHDERIGYVVPLQVCVDGASRYVGEPVRVGEPWGGAVSVAERPAGAAVTPAVVVEQPSEIPVSAAPPVVPHAQDRDKSTHVLRAIPESAAPAMPERVVVPETAPAQGVTHGARHEYEARHVSSPAAERSASAGMASPGPASVVPPVPEAAPWAVMPVVASEAPYAQDQLGGPEPADPAPQARREPSTMRLSAVKPAAPAAESAVPAQAPEQPKRDPNTLPLSAARPASTAESAVTAATAEQQPNMLPLSAAKPASASEPGAPEVKPASASVEPAVVDAGPRREPRTMPLKAAKPTESAESAPAAGGAVPSTFVLRAVPEPKDGPLAQPPRTPGLPLTLPGIPVTPDNPTPSSEPIRDAAPHTGPAAPAMPEPVQDPSPHAGPAASMMPEHTQNPGPHADPAVPVTPESFRDAAPSTGTVVPPTGEFGPVTEATTGPELPPLPPQSAPSAWQPDGAANSKPSHTSNTPAPGPISLEPQPWPPNQNSAPVQPRDAVPLPAPKPISLEPQPWPPAAPPTPLPASMPAVTPNPIHEVNPEPEPEPVSAHPTDAPPALATPEESAADPYSAPEWKVMEEDLGPKPTPVREFDAVAEAVLDPAETDGGAASPFAEPMSRINEAVKMGRINEAAEMAEQTVAQATAALGPQHHEVLRIRELTAYIAYLAGDALRSFHLSLDLAVLRHRLQDPRAAYGNIQSAAAAWRAVRDPLQGLHLGRDLITVWTELAADAGPAADDLEQLEKARTRMGRLAERARALDAAPYAGSPHAHGQ
ncbi:hypothetical protein Sipo8835_15490 [Streptomyces ipomoeae]|uniref:Uncharacterized protein n=2 Tax=Streptomyces ipomoeae TaxID=103232 RepID=A0AAE8W2I5_9ACTN|nr:hypothetical protein Sipo7851_26740 [Streptomyces ipomoeae]TQE34339.1 hypothetical protein Sipo8835_15490 [Streptomyces ipomoeae]